jgi:hypothetical protein
MKDKDKDNDQEQEERGQVKLTEESKKENELNLTLSYMDKKGINGEDWNIEYLKVKEQYILNQALAFMKN